MNVTQSRDHLSMSSSGVGGTAEADVKRPQSESGERRTTLDLLPAPTPPAGPRYRPITNPPPSSCSLLEEVKRGRVSSVIFTLGHLTSFLALSLYTGNRAEWRKQFLFEKSFRRFDRHQYQQLDYTNFRAVDFKNWYSTKNYHLEFRQFGI